MLSKNTICLWFDGGALDAAHFYAQTFPDSKVGATMRAPGDFPSGKEGDVLTVEFTVAGISCLGLNGGPAFKHTEAFSFQIATDDQAETDRLWNAIVGNGGQESECGWCKDRWGLSWQITPRALTDGMADPDPAVAKRVFDAMMTMRKIDIAAIEKARRGCGCGGARVGAGRRACALQASDLFGRQAVRHPIEEARQGQQGITMSTTLHSVIEEFAGEDQRFIDRKANALAEDMVRHSDSVAEVRMALAETQNDAAQMVTVNQNSVG